MANTYTTKLGLAKPANGDVDWHIPVNENWDKIDTELDKALKISGTTIDADKDWGGKSITNVGAIDTPAGNIGARSEFVDVAAGITTLRKSQVQTIGCPPGQPVMLLSFNIPSSYS